MRSLFIILLVMILFAGCAANNHYLIQESEIQKSGFWMGLIHGYIMPITFIISVFSNDVKIYDVNNVGVIYDFGFIIGSWIILKGGKNESER